MDTGITVIWLLLLAPGLAFYADPWSHSGDQKDTWKSSEGLYVQEVPEASLPDVSKRHSRQHRWWGYASRYPWEKLPDRMCFRQTCEDDTDCCRRYNTCHSDAKICINCWYAKACKSEEDCCYHYPYCDRKWGVDPNTNKRYISGGRCVEQLY